MIGTSCYTGVESDDLCDGNMHLSCVSGMRRTRLVIKQQKEMTSCAYVMRSNVNGEDSFAI